MKRLPVIVSILMLVLPARVCAGDGEVGSSSIGTASISLVIPARLELRQISFSAAPIDDANFCLRQNSDWDMELFAGPQLIPVRMQQDPQKVSEVLCNGGRMLQLSAATKEILRKGIRSLVVSPRP